MSSSVRFAVYGEADEGIFARLLLPPSMKLGPIASSQARESYYDTFDWRLFKHGRELLARGSKCLLRCRETGSFMAEAKLGKTCSRNLPKFAKDFPASPLKDALKGMAGIRALIKVCSVRRRVHAAKLLNKDGKTVAKLSFEQVRLEEGEVSKDLISFMELEPVKGYGHEFEEICSKLRAGGLARLSDSSCIMSLALGATGKSPDDYSSKFHAPLRRGMTCRGAAIAILSSLTDSILRNEHGIVQDIDVGFLHDFRVAIRRIRSALSQIKGVFPEDLVLQFKKDFGEIGRLTNSLRDLDVLLLSRAECEGAIPDELKHGLDEFFECLAKRRATEFERLTSALSKDLYRKTMKHWKAFLEKAPKLHPTSHSAEPVEDMAGRFIMKRLKRILKLAESLDEESPDAAMHSLRIECKKLRYLLEFFGPLYPDDAISDIVGRLKSLQDFLGELNDLSVQQRLLAESLSKLPPKGQSTLLAAAALGALVSHLCERRRKLKRNFSKIFSKSIERDELDELESVLRPESQD